MHKIKILTFSILILLSACKINNDVVNTYDEVYPDYQDVTTVSEPVTTVETDYSSCYTWT